LETRYNLAESSKAYFGSKTMAIAKVMVVVMMMMMINIKLLALWNYIL
jgi:cell division protein FtsX